MGEWQLVFVIGSLVALAALAARQMRRSPGAERAFERSLVRDMLSVAPRRLGAITDESLVRVAGVARPRDGLLVAPLSGRQCLAYRVELYLYGEEKVTRDEDEVATFLLEDDNATAIVVPPVPIVALTAERHVIDGEGDAMPPAARDWLDEHYSGNCDAVRVRLVERRVEPGDRIAVVGWARLDYDDELVGYHAADELVLFANAEGAPLSISDDASLLT